MPKSTPHPRLRPIPDPWVAALAYDGLCTFEFGIAVELFGLPRPELGEGWYQFCVAAAEPGPLRATGGVQVMAEGGLDQIAAAGTVVVPGWRAIDAPVPAPLIDALRAAHARGARFVAICSGAFVLAAAGLLDGRRATTHWRYVEALRAAYPGVNVVADVLYVDEGSIITSAGSAAGIDACLHLVRRDFGQAVANRVARRLVVPPHRDGGQAQYIEAPVPTSHESATLGSLFDWMRGHLHEALPLDRLARRARMSRRTFARRFQAATGIAPGEWLVRERLERAKQMLEGGSDSIEVIAGACGFGSVETFRHHFRTRVGTSPSRYRGRFGEDAQPQLTRRAAAG